MKTHTTCLLYSLCALVITACSIGDARAADGSVALQPYLLRCAAKHHVQFALEVAAGTESPLLATHVTADADTWPEVVTALRRDVGGAEFTEIAGNPPLLVIRERSLSDRKTVLDTPVTSFTFAGSPGELIEQLGTQVPGLKLRTVFATQSPLVVDWTSQARITLPSGTVRDVLNALPRTTSEAILWQADIAADGSAIIAFGVPPQSDRPVKKP